MKKLGAKRSAQEATGQGEDSSALNCLTKCTVFMSWPFPAKHDFSLSQVSRRVILISRFLLVSEACNWIKTFSWKNSKSFIEEESGTGSPCRLSRRACFVFCFLSPLAYQQEGVFRSRLFHTKRALNRESETCIHILTLPPAQYVALGRLFFFPGLKLLKKYNDSDLHSDIVRLKWENGYEILPTSSPKSYSSFIVSQTFYKHYL